MQASIRANTLANVVTSLLMSRHVQLDRLTPDEAAKARRLTTKLGPSRAAKRFGIDVRTLDKACAERRVQRLTAYAIRSRLPETI